MATIATLAVKLIGDASGLKRALGEAQGALRASGEKLTSMGQSLTASVTAPLAGIAAVGLTAAADFEQTMNQIQVISGATQEQFAALQKQALDLGATTSFSAGEAAQAQLELAKAGLEVQDTMSALPGVLDLAAAGGLELSRAAEIATNVLNAFNLPATETANVANMLAATANASSVEVTDLSDSLKMSASVLGAYGQSLEDTLTALALLGNSGLKGSDAGTSLKTAFMSLAAPTDKAKQLMDELGISIYDAQGNMRAMPDILAQFRQSLFGLNEVTVVSGGRTADQAKRMEYLRKQITSLNTKLADYQSGLAGVAQSEADKIVSTDRLNRQLQAAQAEYNQLAGIQGNATTVMKQMTQEERDAIMATIFGTDAVRAMNILLATNQEEWEQTSAAVNKTGAAQEVANARMKGLTGAIEYFKGSVESALIGAFLPFLDMLGGWVRWLADLVSLFGQLSPQTQQWVVIIGAAVAAIGPLLIGLGFMANLMASAIPVVTALAGAFSFLLGPIGLLVGAAALLGLAWYNNWGGIREQTQAVIDALIPQFLELWSWLQVNLPVALAVAQAWFNTAWAAIPGLVSAAWATVGPVLMQMWGWLQVNIPLALATVQAWFNSAWAAIPGLVSAAWGTVGPVLMQMWSWLQVNLPVALAVAQAWFNSAWAVIQGRVSAAWSAMQPTFDLIYNWLQANIPTSLSQVQALWGTAWTGIANAVATAWAAMQSAFTTIQTFVTVTIPLGMAVLAGVWNGVWGSVSSTTTTVTSTVSSAWGQLMAFFAPTIANLQSSFQQMIDGFAQLGPEFQALWAAAQPVLQQLGIAVAIAIGGIAIFSLNEFAAVMKNLPAVVGIVVNQLTVILRTIGTVVSGVVALVQAIFAGDWATAWESAKTVVIALNDFLQNTLGNAIALVGSALQLVGDVIGNILSALGFEAAAEKVRAFTAAVAGLFVWISRLVTGETTIDLKFFVPKQLIEWTEVFAFSLTDWTPTIATLLSWDKVFSFVLTGWDPTFTVTNWSEVFGFTLTSWKPTFNKINWSEVFNFNLDNLTANIKWPDPPGWVRVLLEYLGYKFSSSEEGQALGTAYWQGGGTWVGERGPEYVYLPRGAQVVPNREAMALAGAGGGPALVIENAHFRDERDTWALAYQVDDLRRRRRR